MIERKWLIHTKEGNMVITEKEAIENAKNQEKEGIEPKYYYFNPKTKEKELSPGFLIWSTYKDGCGICHKRKDGTYYVTTGFQGNYCYSL